MAQGERLEALCHIGNLPDLFRAVFPAGEITEIRDFQRRLIHELIAELSGFCDYLSDSGASLVNWIIVRFQTENLKVLVRASLTKVPFDEVSEYIVTLPEELTLDTPRLAGAESPEDFIRAVPKGIVRDILEDTLTVYRDHPRPFFLEAALDRGYFQGLIDRMDKVPRKDRDIIKSMVCQEVDIFHLMLVARGRFHYRMSPDMVQPFHVEGTRIPGTLFTAMLNESSLFGAINPVAERIFGGASFARESAEGATTIDIASLENLAWKRFLHYATRAFRQSHMGFGAVMGYTGLRRIEIADLITISEGIRNGMSADTIGRRLIQTADSARAYV